MAWTIRDDLRLTIKLGLTRGLARIRGLRRTLSEAERGRIADVITDQVLRSNYRIEAGAPAAGHGQNLRPADEGGPSGPADPHRKS
jgi:hypothetical protein